jgi:hypothetical protein
VGSREWRAAVVIGTFISTIIGSDGGATYDHLKRGGGSYWGAPLGAPWCGRRRGRCPWHGGARGGGGGAQPHGAGGRKAGWAAWAERPNRPVGGWAD